ncbi:MAG: hypothetical protein JL50_04935 [Peptococcaceae bacterium BICA1-7]|nr:MAG: hypothetical protein JL50_04935 [Peptococcaceae bacterium BICA1-7]HBV95964.1 DUF3231 domain-containing protein [Desulfotomaculum sp.]
MDLTSFLPQQPKEKLTWGEASGLWDISRFKIIGLTISEIYLAQAKDAELKNSLNIGIEMLIKPHIKKIQEFLHKEGLEEPAIPQRKNINMIEKQITPNSIIEDDEIANEIREVFRYGLVLDTRGLVGCIRDDIRKLVFDIFSDDFKGYEAMIMLHRKKNWLVMTPTV